MNQNLTNSTPSRARGISPSRPAFILLLAFWLALLFSLGEVALDGIRKNLLNRIIGLGPDLVWKIPLADTFIFMIPAVILALVAWVRPKGLPDSLSTFIFASLGFFSWLVLTPLHLLAQLFLALGLGAQLARMVSKYSHVFHQLVRRSLGVLILVVLLMSLLMQGWQWSVERRAMAELPIATSEAPNVLLIVMDTVRAQNMSIYGYERATTPGLERLARSGVLFKHPISPAPWTLPSHASMFTGHWHHELNTDWSTPLDDKYPTLAEGLRANGYLTSGFVANTYYTSYEHGLNRGFIHYEDFTFSLGQVFASSTIGQTLGCWRQLGPGCQLRRWVDNYELLGRKSAAVVNRDFLRWLDRQEERPFFAFLNYFDAHAPYLPPEPYTSKFGPERPRYHPVFVESMQAWMGTKEQLQYEIDAYDGAIAYLDEQIGNLLEDLRQRGHLENTLVIITSDHGEEFQEHGVMSHGNSLFRQSVEVPLLMIFPNKIPSGVVVEEAVSLRNLPATVAQLTNLALPQEFPGVSLSQYWEGEHALVLPEDPLFSEVHQNSSRPDWYPIASGDMLSAVIDGIRIIQNGDGEVEMYDFHNDPYEENRLSPDTGELSKKMGQFQEHLDILP